jgi:3-deoxy-manno-octulosonate cytidylyltransferase (CMP-KDO synthetase)
VTDYLGIIPARYASTRFPGKPLAMLGEKPMIQWVYERASSLFEHLIVATDDRRIYDKVLGFGGKVVMTASDHKSGTDRCAEAASLYEKETALSFSYVVNIQGDEPLIHTEQLQTLLDCIQLPDTPIATLIRPLDSQSDLNNSHVVKVVVDLNFIAMYFSRAPIPWVRDVGSGNNTDRPRFFSHIGLYAFRREVLKKLVLLSSSQLEEAESLEQLRWMEHGFRIRAAVSTYPSLGVDTPEDLQRIQKDYKF